MPKYHDYNSKQRKRDEAANEALKLREKNRHKIEIAHEAKALGLTVEEYLKYVS